MGEGEVGTRDFRATWAYHDATKHSMQSLRTSQHFLDWANQPIPYKIYSSLQPFPLPADFSLSSVPAFHAITVGEPPSVEAAPAGLDLMTLARLCYFSNGITKRLRYPAGEIEFRAAACTGALYHIELYLVCGDPEASAQGQALEAGVYHYGAHDHSLRRLRSGDFRQLLSRATGDESSVARASAVVICTSTFWRNAWKYQARAYRHCFWDDGTLLANLLAVAAADGIPSRVVLGFADDPVNRVLDLDPDREVAISLVALGRGKNLPPSPPEVAPLDLPTVPLSRTEADYPPIRAMHAASSLGSGEEAAAWRKHPPPDVRRPPGDAGEPGRDASIIPLQPLARDRPSDPIENVIRRSGSTRRFSRLPITFAQLSTMLDRATGGIPADWVGPAAGMLNDLYLIVSEVEGLESGSYVLRRDPPQPALEMLQKGDFRQVAERLDLGQELAGDASVNVYFLADLNPVLARFGNRGYRVAQLEAAITAGKLYLAAYAAGLGATGLTFFDDEVTAFFSPHAAGKSVMFLIALGQPASRRPRS